MLRAAGSCAKTNSMRRLCSLVLLLSACASSTANYAGKLTPITGTCDPSPEATLTLRNGQIVFAPAAGAILLQGALAGTDLSASLTVTDPNKRPYILTFRGTRTGPEIRGIYATPRCRYLAELVLTRD
jgi:hypothetical protein